MSAAPATAPPQRPIGYHAWLNWRQIEELREMRRSGMTVVEIHEATGVGRCTISNHTSDLGPRPNGWNHRTVAKELEIVGLSGRHSQAEIAKLADVGMWTVHDVQRKYHIVQRFGRCHVAKRRYAYDEHRWGEILEELYINQRLPMGEVARRCNVDISTIRRRLNELGFRLRTSGEQAIGRKHAHPYARNGPECLTPGCTRHPVNRDFCHDCRRPRRAVAASGYPLV